MSKPLNRKQCNGVKRYQASYRILDFDQIEKHGNGDAGKIVKCYSITRTRFNEIPATEGLRPRRPAGSLSACPTPLSSKFKNARSFGNLLFYQRPPSHNRKTWSVPYYLIFDVLSSPYHPFSLLFEHKNLWRLNKKMQPSMISS